MTNHQPRDVPTNPAEFQEFKRQCQEEGREWTEHLINIIHRLPYSGSMMSTRYIIEQESSNLLDCKPGYNSAHPSTAFSNVRQQQTWREFYATIDRVLGELGLFDEVQRLNVSGTRKSAHDVVTLCELIYPAYVRLRELGYNCYPDLTA